PIVSVNLTPGVSLSGLQAQLTWNGGTPQSAVTFGTSGHSASDTYTLAVQVASPVTTTGLYYWQLSVQVTPSVGNAYTLFLSGTAAVVATDTADPFGPGWSLAGLDRLLTVTMPYGGPTGVLWEYGSGQTRFFQALGNGQFVSPLNDMGSLSQAVPNGTYT